MTVPPLVLERRIDAPPEAVWRAWTEPAVMRRWYCPNPQWPLTVTADLRVGGSWRVVMGSHVAAGHYTDVDEPHRLAFTWRWEPQEQGDDPATSLVEISIEPDGTGSRLVLQHRELPDADEVKGHEEGWNLSLDRLPGAIG